MRGPLTLPSPRKRGEGKLGRKRGEGEELGTGESRAILPSPPFRGRGQGEGIIY
jgi:hypothetical protein